jgi:EAL domain-containing protein (putative c-di-GMP-specific phosphodiesterase class I)
VISNDIAAEGIEKPGQVERLRSMGCDKSRGYLIGKPLTAEELTTLPPGPARRVSFSNAV